MLKDNSDSITGSLLNFKNVFKSMPGMHVLLLPDAPTYTIVSVTDDLLLITGRTREDIIGSGLFQSFPANPDDPKFDGEQNVSGSFKYVIQNKTQHTIPVQRYDIENELGEFQESYWSATNKPIFDDNQDVLYILHTPVDITAEIKFKQRENRIKDLEKSFDLFMQAPVTIAIFKGDDYIIELANESMQKLWRRGKEIIGKPLIIAIPELAGQGFIAKLDDVRKTGNPYYAHESPITIVHNQKEENFFFDFVYQPYYDESNETIASGVICVVHDVTAQVLARDKVAEVTERLNFRNALFEVQNDVTPDGVLIVDAKGNMLLHNHRFVEIWKMPAEIITNKDDNAALMHAQSMLVDPQEFIDKVNYCYTNKKEKSYDVIPFKDGRMIERNGAPIIAENGLYYGWAWYFRDITERIKQEQKFRNVVEQASDPILILKGENMVLEVANKALHKLWRTDETAIGKSFLEILPEMKDQGFLELLQQVYHSGKPFQGYEVPAIFIEEDKKKHTRYFNFTYQPYHEADGSISGVLVLANDVTGQVDVKQKLVESENNLRNTILQAPVAMCILRGPRFIVEIANDRIYKIWGKSAEELIGKPLFEAFKEVGSQGFDEMLTHVYNTRETFAASEVPAQVQRGEKIEIIYLNYVYEPICEPDGTVSGVIVIAVEVTEQVTARKKIEESEIRFRTLANSISQLAWIADADGFIYWYNNRWYEYTGTTLEEMQGWGWEKVHHPDHKERVVNFAKEAWTKKEPYEITFQLRGKNDLYRWFLTRVYPVLDADGKILQWIGTNTDIDEQKQIEASLEQIVLSRTKELENQRNLFDNILKNSGCGISVSEMVRDDKGKLIDAITILVNDAAIKFTGLPKEVYLSKRATDLDPNIFSSPYGLTCLKTLETGEPSLIQYYLEFTGRWLELTLSKMDEDHLIHIFSDVTPIKETQLQLEKMVGELKRSNANLEEFAYAASHDLKEPIRKIEVFISQLKSRLADNLEQSEVFLLGRIENATNRMRSLVDDLLQYSHISERPAKKELFDFKEMISHVLEDLELHITQKNATITIEGSVKLKGYKRQLQQLFQNLISNGLKYNKSDLAPQIKITLAKAERPGRQYHLIEIQDNGIGFDQQHAEKIFKMFVRLHGPSEYSGTGIGLSIVKKVIENHEGLITVESNLGEGSNFKVYLPVD